MPAQGIMDRLASGRVLLMDGGTGSELQRRGVDTQLAMVDEKGNIQGLYPWAATANLETPEVVQQVHADYLGAGAELIISNSFWTNRIRLEPVGLGDRWEEYARAAARLALQARDAGNPEAWVAGGLAPPTMMRQAGRDASDVELMGEEALFESLAEEARTLADCGVDLILPEYVGYIDDCVVAVDACASTGLPVFLGVRNIQPENGTLRNGDSIESLVAALEGHDLAAILLMCSAPEGISAGLPALRKAFDGPIGGYPNIGYTGFPGTPLSRADQFTPAVLGEFAVRWRDMGAQAIGGCCGTGPEHITGMRRALGRG